MMDREALDALALSEREYEAIVERLGREPNTLELGLFGSLWSEHCGYKHSKPLLSMFSFRSDRILVEQGAENAGVVDIGDGLAVVFKIESHNHPSAVEPYEGAATGVGGIVRDIFAMGARPVALLNSLRFGPPAEDRNRYLFGGVVAGISGYGNCIGVPNVGGEVVFSDSYSGNPLVNAMCIGLLRADEMVRSTTGGPGNLLMLVGADTGRDGIHGASALASRTFEDDREMRPTVQVGKPLPGEGADRGVPGGGPARLRGRSAGSRRRRAHQLRRRGGGQRRIRRRDRCVARPAPGRGYGPLRGDAVGVAGADAVRGQGGRRGGCQAGLRKVGPRLHRHRQGDGRRPRQDSGRGPGGGRGAGEAADRPSPLQAPGRQAAGVAGAPGPRHGRHPAPPGNLRTTCCWPCWRRPT